MKKPDYVYVTYIESTPDQVWQALTRVDLMRQWWVDPKAGCARVNVSDWVPGSTWQHQRADGSDIVDILGKVIEFTPPKKMVMTWARPSDEHDPAKHAQLTMGEVLDVNGAGFFEAVIIGVISSTIYDAGKAAIGAQYDMRNNPGESLGSFYDLHF